MLLKNRLTGIVLLLASKGVHAVSLAANSTTALAAASSTLLSSAGLSSTLNLANTTSAVVDGTTAAASSTTPIDVSSAISEVTAAPANNTLPAGTTDIQASLGSTAGSSDAAASSSIASNATTALTSSTDAEATSILGSSVVTSEASPSTSPSLISLGDGLTATAQESNVVVISNSTISVGGAAFTGSSTTISLASSGIINIDGTTRAIASSTQGSQDTSSAINSITSVTATMTTVPTGVSTESISISGVSTNTWLTTSKDGQTTILPVIWCPNCGSGESILLWNLPSSLTDIQLDWTGVFPDLPKITFPCIKVFGVEVGDCPAAETEESNDSEDDTSSKFDDSSKSDASSTSSEACSSSTVSDCRVGCSVSTMSGDISTTICYTTSCFSTVGCSVKPSTTTTISTSSGSQKTLKQTPAPYDMGASWSSLGMETSDWFYGATLTWTGTDDDTDTETESDAITSTKASNSTSTIVDASSTANSTIASSTEAPSTTVSSTTKGTSTKTSAAVTTSEAAPWCYIHGDSSGQYYCQCGEGDEYATSPAVSGECPYTSHPITSSTETTSSPPPGTTTTTYWNGMVQECTSYSKLNLGIAASACVGPTLVSPSPTAECGTSYQAIMEKFFYIGGSNWDTEATDNDGQLFKDKLAECSGNDVKDWDFQMPPDDGTTYDFVVSGEMEGISDCYERAAVDAGGCTVGGSKSIRR